MIKKPFQRVGSSYCLIFDKILLDSLGWNPKEDKVKIEIKGNKIVISKLEVEKDESNCQD